MKLDLNALAVVSFDTAAITPSPADQAAPQFLLLAPTYPHKSCGCTTTF